jgi:hypothetical protein
MKYRRWRDGAELSFAAGVALLPGKNTVSGHFACCDCGLVHIHKYRITKRGTLKITSTRDAKATAELRRRRKA